MKSFVESDVHELDPMLWPRPKISLLRKKRILAKTSDEEEFQMIYHSRTGCSGEEYNFFEQVEGLTSE